MSFDEFDVRLTNLHYLISHHSFEKGGEHQISFEAGDKLELLEITSDKTWYR